MNKLGVVMDPIESISPEKDTTLALMLEAQKRGFEIEYFTPQDLFIKQHNPMALSTNIKVMDDNNYWFKAQRSKREINLAELDLILMRQDPPMNNDYLYVTYVLELAQILGVKVLNDPTEVRSANEKLFALHFPQCMPETLISANIEELNNFITEQKKVIIKPLWAMGGSDIFMLTPNDPNLNIILENSTQKGMTPIMAQEYIPEAQNGDKRIILFDGKPVPQALLRVPKKGETRANIAAGGTTQGAQLNDRDLWLCDQVGSELSKRGLYFVGLDVIGDYITEINVTSPTCIRQIDREFGVNLAAQFFDGISIF